MTSPFKPCAGSPPHTRGKAARSWTLACTLRITPAHAGKRQSRRGHTRRFRDHPRTRGEKETRASTSSALRGSPPHTRGKAANVKLLEAAGRITPAHAGKSWSSQASTVSGMGSPPHTRGKVVLVENGAGQVRITPAHAGKRSTWAMCQKLARDHPRTRGEKAQVQPKEFALLGSPPHTRGKARSSIMPPSTDRITPAHAGKRKTSPDRRGCSWDHPRTRGEKRLLQKPPGLQKGSPPHTRGKD